MFSLHYTGMEGIVNHEIRTGNDMERGLKTENLDLAFTSGGKHAMISIRLKRQKAVGSMDYLSHNIATNLNRIRKSKGMRPDEWEGSRRSGCCGAHRMRPIYRISDNIACSQNRVTGRDRTCRSVFFADREVEQAWSFCVIDRLEKQHTIKKKQKEQNYESV